jgi:hypothetical protein
MAGLCTVCTQKRGAAPAPEAEVLTKAQVDRWVSLLQSVRPSLWRWRCTPTILCAARSHAEHGAQGTGGQRTSKALLAAFRAGCHFNDDSDSDMREQWRYKIPSVAGACPVSPPPCCRTAPRLTERGGDSVHAPDEGGVAGTPRRV